MNLPSPLNKTKPLPSRARFDRVTRLLGQKAMTRLENARVVIFGMGGVGSFAAETLARSGIGNLTLIDGEKICLTNINRQLHALESALGQSKAQVMAERLRLIHPEANIEANPEFYNADSSDRLLTKDVDFVVDAIDTVTAKLHLLATCLERKIPVVSAMGAAGRLDPTAIRISDLCESHTDAFAKDVRKYLHARHGIICTEPTGITAIWSAEPCRNTLVLPQDEQGIPGIKPRTPEEVAIRRREPKYFGTVAFVTGAFGLAAASVVVQSLSGIKPTPPAAPPTRRHVAKK